MVSMGLLGAIGGAGQALQTLGSSLEERRQNALAAAAKLAAEQRERANKLADKEDERDFTVQRDRFREGRQDDRTKATQEFRQSERLAGEDFRTRDREDRQEQTTAERLASQDFRKNLASFQSSLQRSNTAAAIAARKASEAGDVQGVIYGPANAAGVAEAFFYTKDKKLVPTGQKVQRYQPRAAGDKDEADEYGN